MALDKYKQKRDASKTPEPFGGKGNENKLRFVVQKHAASHLHYDFRLEMEGVLKSWAVPKGPSVDPDVKRLAMMVEDHPYDYRNFEGIIPQGQYGGGTVIVWDEGFYEPFESEAATKKEQDKELRAGLHSGKIKFVLHGEKLKGAFALVKAHGRGENGWLLMKLDDKYASEKDITLKDKSVISKKTLEQLAKTSKNIYGQKPAESQQEKLEKKVDTSEKPQELQANDLLKKGKKSKMLTEVKPMLATLVNEPFDSPGWSYEVKWDGYRALAYVNKGKTELLSRNIKSFTEKYYPIAAVMDSWSINAVFDGEILVIGKDGKANFSALQNWRSEADGDLVYYAFDILWYDGKDITGLPLSERQAILREILPANDDHVRLSRVFDINGIDFFEAAQKMGLEGIMAKKTDSTYAIDSRSKDWLKIKVNQRQEVVIGGFTKNEGTSKQFSSLLLGVYEKGKLEYVGKVGTGFSDKKQKEMMELFKPLIIDTMPFDTEPDVNKPSRFRPNPPKAKATWLKPELVCEVSFIEVTADGVFRHPSFEGMRSDKKAKDVVRETATATATITTNEGRKEKLVAPPKRSSATTLLNPKEETQVKKVNGHNLKFTNLSKVYWPEEGYTKRDMFNYYHQVAEYILPHLKDRPLSLNRFPSGIHGKSFYQKDVKGKAPDWAKTYPYHTSDGEDKEFLVGNDEATLLWMASLGCIEMNPWFSKTTHPDNPDYCVIDLDPSDKTTFEQVIQAAREVKDVLDAINVPSYVKTSGSTGIHIYIPLGARYSYDQSQMFARLLVSIVHDRLPDFTSLERKIKDRNGKMYLDFLQNRPGATIACAYSLRPKPGATVSMPLHWDEVKKGLKMKDFTIRNALERIKSEGDLFKGTLEEGIDMEKALEQAQDAFYKKN
ncbi:DNA ligase [Flavobacterium akiainvivens]|uniref:DNA ligase (ATP) n=1 Tax=Flavobacterium akiainvivens TaxID=1202724 RepID=A0A0M8M834_9FLAO|nr:DNA ligase D [Flavobacterium akiainvivens]KOS05433.1 DNA ligase [Flavobacterium akiainvivens]SFQ32023.1 bifunctional non-homologous end joining protein LigD [Flavobacterium akiainvivens]